MLELVSLAGGRRWEAHQIKSPSCDPQTWKTDHDLRSDTLDLQDHDSPSAKDHSRQPTHPAPYGHGPAAPHQQQALRNAESESYHDQRYSPRVSEERADDSYRREPNFYEEPDEDIEGDHGTHNDAMNGVNGGSNEYDDGEQMDDDLDDDLMDKISSSPSISDGKSPLLVWPRRSDSIESGRPYYPFSAPTRGNPCSYFLFTPIPEFPPASVCDQKDRSNRHHLEDFPCQLEPTRLSVGRFSLGYRSEMASPATNQSQDLTKLSNSPIRLETESDPNDFTRYLLPEHDDLLDGGYDGIRSESHDETDREEDGFSFPMDDSVIFSDDDDDDDLANFHFTDDPRFLDSGWGGECLREIEDIDFEFVYALHTFVATVEGQANATKGDTMVLLDDSNSYWWLVRVVKDGSIGMAFGFAIDTSLTLSRISTGGAY